jgi:hypothetical protein
MLYNPYNCLVFLVVYLLLSILLKDDSANIFETGLKHVDTTTEVCV